MYKTATITYTYGNGLISDSKKEAKDSDTEKRYYHYNHIGSTTAITDAGGDLLYSFTYGTYGELTGIYDADGQKWQEKQQAKAASGKPCRQKSSASCTMEDMV